MRLLTFSLLLLTVALRGAVIGIDNLDPTQFTTNNVLVNSITVHTNEVGLIRPALANYLTTLTNVNQYGTVSWPSKVTSLSLGTNYLDLTLQSSWLLNSPTNDAAQVILSLSAGAYQGQQIELISQNDSGGFTLPNLSEQYDVPGGLVVIGSDWVATTNRGIRMTYSAPDIILSGIPTDPSVPGGGAGSVGPGTVDTLAKFGPSTTSITNSLVTEDATRLIVSEIIHPNSIALNNTYTLLDMNNIVLTVINGLFDLESDDPVAANRVFTLGNGTEDNFELRLVWHTNAGELLNAGNVILSQDWIPNNGDSLQLMWDAVGSWREQWRYPPAGGFATNALWASASGNLFPSPTVDVVSITSQSADNATNVAFVVDTATTWTNGQAQVSVKNNSNKFFNLVDLMSVLGGHSSTISLSPTGTATNDVSWSVVTSASDPSSIISQETLKASTDSYSQFESRAKLTTLGNGDAKLEIYSTDNSYTDEWQATLSSTSTNLSLKFENLDGDVFTYLNPLVTSTGSSVAYLFDTLNVLTNGDKLVSFRNATSEKFSLDATGTSLQTRGTSTVAIDPAGNSIFFKDSTSTEIIGSGLITAQRNSIGVSDPSASFGFLANNTFSASAGTQQNSPAVSWQGQGWGTNSATSQPVLFGSYVIPSSGADTPTAKLVFTGSISNASPTTVFSMKSSGPVTLSGITKAQKTALVPNNGDLVYQTDNTAGFRVYIAGTWFILSTAADP